MWQQPKTDWKSGEYFNIGDYNRIKNNLNEIRERALVLWKDFEFEDMGNDKSYADISFFADEINKFENNIDLICAGTYPFALGERKVFYENTPFIDWIELNRIESACLKLYETFTASATALRRLEFTLNGGDF